MSTLLDQLERDIRARSRAVAAQGRATNVIDEWADRLSAIRAAVGGEVVCHRLHTPGGKWQWMNGMPSKQALEDSKNFGWEMEYAYTFPPGAVDVEKLLELLQLELGHTERFGYCWFHRNGKAWTGNPHITLRDANLERRKVADELAALIGEK